MDYPMIYTSLAVLCSAATAAATSRETVSFNFGWRFSLGDPAGTPQICSNMSAFDENMTQGCSNMVFAPLKSPFDCFKACCPGSGYHPDCRVWQFAESQWLPNGTRVNGCYLGSTDSVCPGDGIFPPSVKWSGGRKSTPFPPQPAGVYAGASFDDSRWELLDVPHDFVVHGDFDPSARDNGEHGYLPREKPGWYRKHFTIPSDWQNEDTKVTLRFNGVFHVTEAWLDGAPLALTAGSKSGYTSFTATLPHEKKKALKVKHVLALRVDASYGSGHWYEGGGIYRDCFIEATSLVHIAEHGLFAASDTDAANNRSVAHPVVKVINTDSKHVKNVHVTFHIYGPDGSLATPVATSATGTIAAGTTFEFDATDAGVQVPTPQLWSIQSPSLYTLVATVFINKNAVDSLNATFGLRSATFSADSGFALNDNHVVLRGFSNHNDMAGVGVAVPQRLNLFRAQMLRGVGANIWRMSHNPGDPATFDLLDRLGIMSWDENRDYGRFQVGDMKDMVLRDRNHPAIIIWSFCNEVECTEHGESEGAAFRAATLEADHTRPISGNLLHDSSGSMLDHFDVVGISHVSTIPAPWTPTPASWYDPRYSFKWFHKNHPTIPLVSSESTSCNTQRGENVVNTAAGVFDDVFNADCLSKHFCPPNTTKALDQNISGYMHSPGLCTQSWTMAYEDDGTIFPFIGGHLGIWTLFDYIGEPSSRNRKNPCNQDHNADCNPNWPQVSCNYGSFDLAGFAKPAASWYRSWWLAHIAEGDKSRPPIGNATAVVKIVHDWNLPAPPIVSVYSNLASVELFLNGISLGKQSMGWANWTEWTPEFIPGNLTAVGYDKGGAAVAHDTSLTVGTPSTIQLSLDAPSIDTGTGEAILLDGQDAALVRVTVVDVDGNMVSASNHIQIDFKVVSGPGRVIGVGNGNPTSHERNKASTRRIYNGLARAVVQSNVNSATADRARLAEIDVEGGQRTRLILVSDQQRAHGGGTDQQYIVLEASANNVAGTATFSAMAQIKIPVSSDAVLHRVDAVAARSVVLEHLRLD